MFLAASRTLARMVTRDEIADGRVYPCLTRIREVSLQIAIEVAKVAYREGLTDQPEPADLAKEISSRMFQPEYAEYI
jgi:malate dehydrogenase (oxaloacetate-decarboxylating)(NADP+)